MAAVTLLACCYEFSVDQMLPSVSAGELFDQISRQKQLPMVAARVYAAEIVLILEVLRKEQVRPFISEGLHDLVCLALTL